MAKLLKFFNKQETLEQRVKHIQAGDEEDKNRLIQEYIPFIKKVISNHIGAYVDVETHDAFRAGLMAFNEAIEKYQEHKGNFLTFASLVIKSRFIDAHRKASKTSKEVFVSQLENDLETTAEHIMAVDGFESELEMKLDLRELIRSMEAFGVSLENLVDEAPKHEDTRKMAIKIARYIVEHKELCNKVLNTKNLPTKDIMENLKVSKKVIQRSRKFIIAVILILESDLDTLKRYILNAEGREESDLQRKYN